MPYTVLYNKQQIAIVNLFRKKAMYTRDEMRIAAAGIYKCNNTLFHALTTLSVAGILAIRRSTSTWRKRGIAAEYRLTVDGLQWLVDQDPAGVPVLVDEPKKQRNKRAAIDPHRHEMQACGVRMKVCYSSGCYLRDTCAAYRGNW